MVDEIARWRIAYDTISALVAVDQSRVVAQQPVSPAPVTAAAAAAAADGGGRSCAASYTSSHHDSRDMIQRQRRMQPQQQPQQQHHADAADVQLTQSPLSTVSTVLRSSHSTHTQSSRTSVPTSNQAMTSVAGECGARGAIRRSDDASRLLRDGHALVALFRRLVDMFYVETMLWMYTSVLLQPTARRTRDRLQWLGTVTGRGVEEAASNVLTGFVAGYRQSRQALNDDVEAALTATTAAGRARRLDHLAVELGVVLNPRQMMRSLSAVVRDLVVRASSQTALAIGSPSAPASHLYRYRSQFLPARRRVIAMIACLSVCLCVCLCVTRRYCIKTAKRRITQTTPRYSPGTLVF